MPKRKRVIAVGVGVDYQSRALSPNWYAPKWDELEKKFGRKLPEPLREDISGWTCLFGVFAGSARTKRPSELSKAIKLWQSASTKLAQRIFLNFSGSLKITERTTIAHLKKKYNSDSWGMRPENGPDPAIRFFADSLETSIAASNYLLKNVGSARSPEIKNQWEIWVALVRNSFHDHKIKTTAASGDKLKADSPFVRFLGEYQRGLPRECRRYSEGGSLAKGVQIANRKYEGVDSDYLHLQSESYMI